MVNPWKLSELLLMLLGAGMEPQADDDHVGPHPHRQTELLELGTSLSYSALPAEQVHPV